MGAMEREVVKLIVISAVLSPIFWVGDKISNLGGGPVGFLSRKERQEMKSHHRIKEVKSKKGSYLQDSEIEVVTKHYYPGTTHRVVMRIQRHEDGFFTIYQPILNTPGDAIVNKRKLVNIGAYIPVELFPLIQGTGCTVNNGNIELKRITCSSITELVTAIFKVVDLSLKIVEAA